MFINTSTHGFIDGNDGPLFDLITHNGKYGHIVAELTDFTETSGGAGFKSITFTFLPEPTSAALLGWVGLALWRRRRSR